MTRSLAPWVLLATALHVGLAAVASREAARHLGAPTPPAGLVETEVSLESAPEAAEPFATTAPAARAPRGASSEHAGGPRVEAPHAGPRAPEVIESADADAPGWSAPFPSAPASVVPPPLALGLGASASGGTNLNVALRDLPSLMGDEERRQRLAAEDARRVEEHRARFAGMGIGPWRSAIEGYAPAVRVGNQKPLGPAQAPFVDYLKGMQHRIHPIFADGFVEWLRSLPSDHPLRRPRLSARIEMAIDAATGAIARMGVVLASGVTAFDVGVLDAVKRASPFGPAPQSITSEGGSVYVQWEFTNEPFSACTVANARPAILDARH